MSAGKLVVAMGLPGSGKSSVFRELSKITGYRCLHEPEESNWGAAVSTRKTCGCFTALMWFRSQRVPDLFEAYRLRKAGLTVLVDSYFDKLVSEYLGKPGMEWLIETDDPYFRVASEVAQLDWKLLPEADTIIFFELDESTWKQFIDSRGRQLDNDPEFRNSFRTQDQLRAAANKYCSERGATLIPFVQKNSGPHQAAKVLSELIQ